MKGSHVVRIHPLSLQRLRASCLWEKLHSQWHQACLNTKCPVLFWGKNPYGNVKPLKNPFQGATTNNSSSMPRTFCAFLSRHLEQQSPISFQATLKTSQNGFLVNYPMKRALENTMLNSSWKASFRASIN